MCEEGKISKQALLTMGAFLTGAALGAASSAKVVEAEEYGIWHTSNSFSVSYSGGTASATHTHHASHTSY